MKKIFQILIMLIISICCFTAITINKENMSTTALIIGGLCTYLFANILFGYIFFIFNNRIGSA